MENENAMDIEINIDQINEDENEDDTISWEENSVSTIYTIAEDVSLFKQRLFNTIEEAKEYIISTNISYMRMNTPFYLYFKLKKEDTFIPVALFVGLEYNNSNRINKFREILFYNSELGLPSDKKISLSTLAKIVYEKYYKKKVELNGWRKLYYNLKTPLNGKHEYIPIQKLITKSSRRAESVLTHDNSIILSKNKDGKFIVPHIRDEYKPKIIQMQ